MKTILRIDASLLKESACMERVGSILFDGYRAPLANNDTEFGSAFHNFIAVAKRTGNEAIAVKAARDYYRRPMHIKSKKAYMTETHLTNVCLSYWADVGENDEFETLIQPDATCSSCHGKKVINTQDIDKVIHTEPCSRCNGTGIHDEPMVELRFAVPYYSDDEVEVLLCGTVDDICRRKREGAYCIRDYKTTSSYDADEFFLSFHLNPQLIFYLYILKIYAKLYPSSIFADIMSKNPLTMIQGIFLKGKDKTEFLRSDMIPFDDIRMDEFELLVQQKVMAIVAAFKDSKLRTRDGIINGACQTVYGLCKFHKICRTTDPITRALFLKNDFIQQTYDPSKWGE